MKVLAFIFHIFCSKWEFQLSIHNFQNAEENTTIFLTSLDFYHPSYQLHTYRWFSTHYLAFNFFRLSCFDYLYFTTKYELSFNLYKRNFKYPKILVEVFYSYIYCVFSCLYRLVTFSNFPYCSKIFLIILIFFTWYLSLFSFFTPIFMVNLLFIW